MVENQNYNGKQSDASELPRTHHLKIKNTYKTHKMLGLLKLGSCWKGFGTYIALSREVCMRNPEQIYFLTPMDFFHTEAHTILLKGSYMSAHVLINLLNELTIKSEAPLNILLLYRHEFIKLNDTGAQMLDLIYHMTKNYFKIVLL